MIKFIPIGRVESSKPRGVADTSVHYVGKDPYIWGKPNEEGKSAAMYDWLHAKVEGDAVIKSVVDQISQNGSVFSVIHGGQISKGDIGVLLLPCASEEFDEGW